MRPHLRSQTPETLAALWPEIEVSREIAGRVVQRLVFDDGDDLVGVRGLAKAKARALLERGRLDRLAVIDSRQSDVDPFVKYLLRSTDGAVLETVRIPLERPRFSVCVSTQVGCGLACAFCETGRMGLSRNLEPWEMVDQVLTVRREARQRPVTGVVFQGQGEPLQNYDNVMRAAAILRHPNGARIGGDRITLSTVGILPAIERFTEEGHPYRLILSLTSAFGEKRAQLIPVGHRWDVPRLAAAMSRQAAARRTVVSLAWVLIAGFNSGPEEARELARLFAGSPLRLSVIDVNDPSGRFRRADDAERSRFFAALVENGIPFVRRYSGGPDIHAACGMLASQARGGVEIV